MVYESKTIECALRVLDLMNSANSLKDLKHRIDYKEFYNDAINKEISLKEHIVVWLKEREKAKKENRPFDKFATFNLCAFPWVLDASSKSEIMKLEQRIKQSRQMDQSLFGVFHSMMLN